MDPTAPRRARAASARRMARPGWVTASAPAKPSMQCAVARWSPVWRARRRLSANVARARLASPWANACCARKYSDQTTPRVMPSCRPSSRLSSSRFRAVALSPRAAATRPTMHSVRIVPQPAPARCRAAKLWSLSASARTTSPSSNNTWAMRATFIASRMRCPNRWLMTLASSNSDRAPGRSPRKRTTLPNVCKLAALRSSLPRASQRPRPSSSNNCATFRSPSQ